MNASGVGARAAQRLTLDEVQLARVVTDALYAERPELLDEFGERGRAKTDQDMRYNVQHLVPAVELEQPDMFVQYVQWLDAMLLSRGVQSRHVTRCLELLVREVESRYPEDESEAISRIVNAGIAVVGVR